MMDVTKMHLSVVQGNINEGVQIAERLQKTLEDVEDSDEEFDCHNQAEELNEVLFTVKGDITGLVELADFLNSSLTDNGSNLGMFILEKVAEKAIKRVVEQARTRATTTEHIRKLLPRFQESQLAQTMKTLLELVLQMHEDLEAEFNEFLDATTLRVARLVEVLEPMVDAKVANILIEWAQEEIRGEVMNYFFTPQKSI